MMTGSWVGTRDDDLLAVIHDVIEDLGVVGAGLGVAGRPHGTPPV